MPTPTLVVSARAVVALVVLPVVGCGPEAELAEANAPAARRDAVTADAAANLTLVATSALKLRRGPGTGYAELALIPQGTRVTTTVRGGPTDGFYPVAYNGQRGWAYGAFLRSPTAVYGYYPDARDALLQLGVTSSRVSQTIGNAVASAGYHAKDGAANGVDYCAATDVRTVGLTEAQIKALLEGMARLGFAGWYRKPGFDGWPSSEAPHIHTIHVSAPMKAQLAAQVSDWLVGRNGLTSHTSYTFYRWSTTGSDTVKRLMGKLAPPVGRDGDGDGKLDFVDNCPAVGNADQLDTDGDGQGDGCDTDNDGDGVADGADNCPVATNASQADQDRDGVGDACDPDLDGDGRPNAQDNCPRIANPAQADADRDGIGDACEADDDGDGVADATDNCPGLPNADQSNVDGDARGDACDSDADGDGTPDAADTCPLVANAGDLDLDGDGRGAACDDDDDGDAVADPQDNCAALANPGQEDDDGNGVGDACELMVIPADQQEVPADPSDVPGDESGEAPVRGCSETGAGPLLLVLGALLAHRRR